MAVAAVVLLAAPAEAGQLRDWPDSTGKLAQGSRTCDREKPFGALDTGTEVCTFGFYALPEQSGDVDNYYYVDWVNYRARPVGGCLLSAHGSTSTDETDIVAFTPSRSSSGNVRLELPVERKGDGKRLGSVSGRYSFRGGTLETSVKRRSKGDRLTWKWRGRTRNPVTFSFGIAMTRPVSAGDLSFTASGDTFHVSRDC